MVSQFTLTPIEANTKGQIRRLRQAGFVPVSIQQKGSATLHFQQDAKVLDEFFRKNGKNTFLDMLILPENRLQRVVVSTVHRDSVSENLLQVTFQHVGGNTLFKTNVRLVFQGEPDSVHRKESFLQFPLDQLHIECDPTHLPDHITVNVADMLPGDTIRISDLPANSDYKILTPANTTLALLTHHKALPDAAVSVTGDA